MHASCIHTYMCMHLHSLICLQVSNRVYPESEEKMVRQLQKNKELFTEVVAETVEKGVDKYSEVVQDAVKFASIIGLSCGEGGCNITSQ
jgi:CRISPR/Cas system-associated protein Cas10 (large subunit of type III CRISPR-Cas system)